MIIIDRIEEGIAVCETDGGQITLDLRNIPEAEEGDVLFYADGCWQIDVEETAARRARLCVRARRIPRRGGGPSKEKV